MYDETLRTLKEQFDESQQQVNLFILILYYFKEIQYFFVIKNQKLTGTLQGLQTASKETRDKLTDEVNLEFMLL